MFLEKCRERQMHQEFAAVFMQLYQGEVPRFVRFLYRVRLSLRFQLSNQEVVLAEMIPWWVCT